MGSDIGWNFGTEIRRIFWSKSGPCIISFMSGDGFGMLVGSFGETFWGPKPIFSATCLKELRQLLIFENLHGVQARGSFWKFEGAYLELWGT
jgi:hypothetical protein